MRILAIMAAALLTTSAGARMVTAGQDRSWGKAGVSLAQYRADGIACAREAAATDLAKTDPARALVIATRLLESDPSAAPPPTVDPIAGATAGVDAIGAAGTAASTVRAIGPERQILKAGDIMKARLEACLARAGYVKFRLTGEQRRRLRSLKEGSEERRTYLHSLARDPIVLAQQRVH